MKNKKIILLITAIVLIVAGGIGTAVVITNNKKDDDDTPFVPKFLNFPQWAIDDLGFYHPNNLEQDIEKSEMSAIKEDPNAFDSFIFVYKPNMEVALKEASIFANRYELVKNETVGTMEEVEIQYDNITQTEEPYIIIIRVDHLGVMTMSAINRAHIGGSLPQAQ